MKKVFAYMLSLLCSLFLSIIANNVVIFADSDVFSYEIVNGEAKITRYQGSENIIIPNEFDGYLTTTIGYRAFLYNVVPKSVQLPINLNKIEDEAFICVAGLGLTDIQVPQSVTNIGYRAIGYSFLGEIGDYKYCKKLTNTIIRGYKGTAAEAYANENGFTFIALDEPAITTTQVTTSTTTTTTTTVTTAVDSSTSVSTSTEELTTTDIQTTAAVSTTMPISTTGAESIVTTETSTVPTTVTTPAVITTETGTKLPQTGYSIWYQSLVAVAMGMVGVGSAAIVRSGMFRKKDSNS